jgi:hypothetical protein
MNTAVKITVVRAYILCTTSIMVLTGFHSRASLPQAIKLSALVQIRVHPGYQRHEDTLFS